MNNVIDQMLSKYEIKNTNDKINALKEIIQEIVLSGLSRSGFFDEVAFYGGTALRMFYKLDRFSENLDFSLISSNKEFELSKYFTFIEKELTESKYIEKDSDFDINILKKLLINKFNEIDYVKAKEDIIPFITNIDSLKAWNKDFLVAITSDLK